MKVVNDRILVIVGFVVAIIFVAMAVCFFVSALKDKDMLRLSAKIIAAVATAYIGLAVSVKGLRQGALSVEVASDCIIVRRLLWKDVIKRASIVKIELIAKMQNRPTSLRIEHGVLSSINTVVVVGPSAFLSDTAVAIKKCYD